jgi:hypothetical protein
VQLPLERNATVAFLRAADYDQVAPHRSDGKWGKEAMRRFKPTVLAAAAALTCLPLRPALAGGPLLVAPWAVGHLFRAASALATLPLSIAAAAAQSPPPYYAAPYYAAPAYAANPGGYNPGGYYAPPPYYPAYNYYPRAGGYYGAPAYSAPPAAYRPPTFAYARPMPTFQQGPRGYYAPGMRYSGWHGGQVFGASRGFGHRHW